MKPEPTYDPPKTITVEHMSLGGYLVRSHLGDVATADPDAALREVALALGLGVPTSAEKEIASAGLARELALARQSTGSDDEAPGLTDAEKSGLSDFLDRLGERKARGTYVPDDPDVMKDDEGIKVFTSDGEGFAAHLGLKPYRSHKKVWAGKIQSAAIGNHIGLEHGIIVPPAVWWDRFKPKAAKDGLCDSLGYLVVYEDGYQSWSPTKAFEDGYSRIID